MAITTQMQLEIKTSNPFERTSKIKAIKQLAKLDTKILEKLAQLAQNNKAIDQINNNFDVIKSFIS